MSEKGISIIKSIIIILLFVILLDLEKEGEDIYLIILWSINLLIFGIILFKEIKDV